MYKFYINIEFGVEVNVKMNWNNVQLLDYKNWE